jgi:hypothetical protein
MLRPWVPLIALTLCVALVSLWFPQALVWAGGGLLALALLSGLLQPAWARLQAWRQRRRQRARMVELDWKLIDNSLSNPRLQQDCERPGTLGVCTGRDCMVYQSCNFNIKRPLP